jgi:hypothetical protein
MMQQTVQRPCIDDLFFVVVTIASGEHPYYPFVIFGGMLIGIIQSEWCYREISEETNLSKIDILLKKGRILLGAILIIIEIVIRMLYPSMFIGLPLITRIFSYIILAVLPIEIIVFNSFLVKKHNGMAI